MSLRAAAAFAALVLLAHAAPVAAAPHRPGEVLVVRLPSDDLELAPAGRLTARGSALPRLFAARGLDGWEALGPARAGRRSTFVRLTSRDPGFDPVAAARELRASGAVRAAIPNVLLRLDATIPDDFYLDLFQYAIQSPDDADIDLPEAWDVTQGDTSVVIGIADTGVDTGHPDLASQIARNWGEIPGNAVDDDGNGLVDDVLGWDFGDDDADPNPGPFFDSSGLDAGFHGTFVAGIAAAATDNTEGIAGAAWRCRILPLKVADSAGEMTSSSLAEAMLYAADRGVDVLNLSLGAPADSGVAEFFQQLVDTFNASGGVIVAAAGNDGSDLPSYPAANAGVIAVAATDESNARAAFSNFGPWVDVAAPGATMWSSLSRNYEIDPLTQFFFLLFFGWDGTSPYMFGDGTSFACPMVSGTAALVRSVHPWMTGADVAAHLVATGDSIGYDQPIGRKVNAFAAVSVAPVSVPRPAARTPRIALLGPTPHPVHGAASLRFTLPAPGRARLRLYDTQGRLVRELADGPFPAGPQSLAWSATRADGSPLPSGVYHVALDAAGERATRRVVVTR